MLLLPKTIAKCQGIFPGLCPFLFNSAPTIHHPIHILLKYHYHKAIWIGGHAPHLNNLSYPPSSAFHTLHTLHSCHCLALYRYIPSKHNWCHAIRINPACHSFQVGLHSAGKYHYQSKTDDWRRFLLDHIHTSAMIIVQRSTTFCRDSLCLRHFQRMKS